MSYLPCPERRSGQVPGLDSPLLGTLNQTWMCTEAAGRALRMEERRLCSVQAPQAIGLMNRLQSFLRALVWFLGGEAEGRIP